MDPTLCIIGGCNGAEKATLARELLPRLGLMRFLNADEIARGHSPPGPSRTPAQGGGKKSHDSFNRSDNFPMIPDLEMRVQKRRREAELNT